MARSVDAPLAVGSEPPRENIEQDHDWSGHQQSSDQSEADQKNIDPGPFGKAGGDAHHLALGPVEHKTLVHFSFLVDLMVRRSAERWWPRCGTARRGWKR